MGTKCCSDVKILVCIITVLFGMGSWIAINGIWVELPILVDELPEGWNLPSYLTVVVQIANIGPISYIIFSVLSPNKSYERSVVFVMVILGSVASLLLAFFWMKTSEIGGEEHSTALLVLMFFLSLVDCTSSVVFLPFMNIFKPDYMTSYYIGEGFSGLVPSLVALGQGVGKVKCDNVSFIDPNTNVTDYRIQAVYLPPHFPVKDFFIFVFSMMVTCGLAFCALNYLPYCKTEHVAYKDKSIELDTSGGSDKVVISSNEKILETRHDYEAVSSNDVTVIVPPSQTQTQRREMSILGYIYFLLVIGWTNALTNGILPSVQTFACLPYGSEAYHLAVTFSNIANPLACFGAFFLPVKSAMLIGAISLVGSVTAAYIMVLAVGSPTPILVDSDIGAYLVVIAFVIVYLTLTFSKVSIATLFRYEGRKALLWCGAITQLGSAMGAAAMFVVVNVYQLFQQKYPCT